MPEPTATRRVVSCDTRLSIIAQAVPGRRPDGRQRSRRLHLPAVGRSAAFFDLDKTVIAKSSALAFGRPFYRDGLINPYVYAEAAALIEEHQAAGRDVVLVSSSGEEIVRPIGELLGIKDVIATRMVVEDGRYTGAIAFYAAGGNKVSAIRQLAQERAYDLAESYAYSDSISDAPLLESVGHPTAVNADRGLRRLAAEQGWPMLEFRHPIPLSRRLRQRPGVPVAAAIGVGIGVAIGLLWYGRYRRARAAAA